MRVISGSARGTRLKPPKGTVVRPTSDRVKESLFNILGNRVPGSTFIDLFAGSGAIGIEALSRGSDHCIFIDNRRENILLIQDNLKKTRLVERARLIKGNADAIISRLNRENIKADLIFLDPPYHSPDTVSLLQLILASSLFHNNSLIIVEHSKNDLTWTEYFTPVKQKIYGQTCLTFIAKQ